MPGTPWAAQPQPPQPCLQSVWLRPYGVASPSACGLALEAGVEGVTEFLAWNCLLPGQVGQHAKSALARPRSTRGSPGQGRPRFDSEHVQDSRSRLPYTKWNRHRRIIHEGKVYSNRISKSPFRNGERPISSSHSSCLTQSKLQLCRFTGSSAWDELPLVCFHERLNAISILACSRKPGLAKWTSASMGPESGRLFPLFLEIPPYTMNTPVMFLQSINRCYNPPGSLCLKRFVVGCHRQLCDPLLVGPA